MSQDPPSTPKSKTTALATDDAQILCQELDWFSSLLTARLQKHLEGAPSTDLFTQQPPPVLEKKQGLYDAKVQEHQMGSAERFVLMLASAPHLAPETLDPCFVRNTHLDRTFSEIGGLQGEKHSGILTTVETALFF